MRIMIYSNDFFPKVGGAENYALDLALELAKQGEEVSVVTAEPNSGADSFPFPIFRLKKPFPSPSTNINFLELPVIISQFKPDLFHINYANGSENILISMLALYRKPIVLTYHANHIVPAGRMIDEMQSMTSFRLLSKIIVQRRELVDMFTSRGLPAARISYFQISGIDTEKFNYVERDPKNSSPIKIICIARLDRQHKYKGVDLLLDSINREKLLIASHGMEIRIIGGGPLKNYFERIATGLGLNNVFFLGDVSEKSLIDEMHSASFLIMPSSSKGEGFGRAALESISCGTPIIVSKYAGISDIVKQHSAGIIYDPFNDFDIFSKIWKTFHEKEVYLSYIKNGIKMLDEEGLTRNRSVNMTYSIYKELLARGKIRKKYK